VQSVRAELVVYLPGGRVLRLPWPGATIEGGTAEGTPWDADRGQTAERHYTGAPGLSPALRVVGSDFPSVIVSVPDRDRVTKLE